MARKILLLLVLCVPHSAGPATRLLSFCTVIYGNGAQGVLRARESGCHKVASERLVERCPVICVYANDKTRVSAAANTHAHVHTYSGHAVSIFSSCSSASLLATPVPSSPQTHHHPHCLMQLFSPDRSDPSFLLTSDSI